ncbi:hybrid sensor histidine kinase/response regulator [Methylomonas koyamae]|uniref:ATP-binding response regulator n=1 Tax=Methylomonas koyamae TaxID=702114 RepID=UPI0011284FC9|nr:hybrid sensor histidine kinase/response regulator [Methylomonas koyamae]TPQ26047.1 hybrid sensor histidine kinase/response regulator [Methylomonas koyamae]
MLSSRPFVAHFSVKSFLRPPAAPASISFNLKELYAALTPRRLFAIPQFDADTEQEFWRERYQVLLSPLKWALALGACAFLAYILLDLHTGTASTANACMRLPIVLLLFGLFHYLQHCPNAADKINGVAKLSAGLSATQLIAVLLIEDNPRYYQETWPALLPMYFFSYGQMFMSLRATIGFGWSTTLAMPLAGYWLGLSIVDLIPSILNLFIVNLFGVCTRCQLEAYARNSFREKRKVEIIAERKSCFLRQLSHNLRQPLQALNCYASVLETACAEPAGQHLQAIAGRMGFAIDELSRAINHILDIGNLENGTQRPLLTHVDINLLLAGLENQFAPQAAKRDLKLIVHLRQSPPFNVYSDPSILSQIIGNLLDNAIKYTQSGWIVVSAVKIGPDRLKLHVRDSGPGIAAEVQGEIFKEFVRGRRRTSDQTVPGLGIGLAYVATAIQHLPEHRLELCSRPQHGSDFRIDLPISHSAEASGNSPTQTGDLAGRYILAVDDDAEMLAALSCQLRAWGCDVQTATSLAETRLALADNLLVPDLLITDFYLNHNETAHDIVAAVHADCGPVPILVLSAAGISDQEKAKWPANTCLLRKPARSDVLMGMMVKAMEREKNNSPTTVTRY